MFVNYLWELIGLLSDYHNRCRRRGQRVRAVIDDWDDDVEVHAVGIAVDDFEDEEEAEEEWELGNVDM